MTRVPLLSFAGVSKSWGDGRERIAVLRDVSFELDRGAFVGVWGSRRSGKSTLLRLMAGIDLPDAGTVRFDGTDTAAMSVAARERLLRSDIALMAPADWRPRTHETLVDYVALSLGSGAHPLRESRRQARIALERVGLTDRADAKTGKLSMAERVRAMLARSIVRTPRLLLVDEPALVPSLAERDALYALLREIAAESGTTLVVASEDMAPLHGAEIVMSIGGGELCSTDERGVLVEFPGGAPVVPPRP